MSFRIVVQGVDDFVDNFVPPTYAHAVVQSVEQIEQMLVVRIELLHVNR
jgi:hypothetical protein